MPAAFTSTSRPPRRSTVARTPVSTDASSDDVEHRGGEALADALGVGQLGGADEPGLVDVDGVDGARLLQQAQHGGAPDARAAAGHDDASVLESFHDSPPRCGNPLLAFVR